MMKTVGFLICFSALVAGTAQAETTTAAACREHWSRVERLLDQAGQPVTEQGAVRLAGGDCRIEGLVLGAPAQYRPSIRIARVSWRGEGLNDHLATGVVPRALDLRAEGVRFSIETGDPLMSYLLQAQSAPYGIDAAVSLRYDAGARRLRVTGLDLDFPGDNSVSLSGVLERIDLGSDRAAQMSVGSMAVTELDLEVVSNGLFESYLLMPLGAGLLSGAEDPAVAVDAMIAEGQALVAGLPGTTFSAETRAALRALLADMPNPAGSLMLSLRSEAGVGPARLSKYAISGGPTSLSDLAPVLEGVTIDASYRRTLSAAE